MSEDKPKDADKAFITIGGVKIGDIDEASFEINRPSPEIYTKRFFKCDCERPKEWSVDHLFKKPRSTSFGPWYCSGCGHSWSGKVNSEDEVFDLVKSPEAQRAQGVLLKLSVPSERVRFVYRDECTPNNKGDLQYLIHEHQCPMNTVSGIEEIFVDGEDDWHGVFEIVAVGPEPMPRRTEREELDEYNKHLVASEPAEEEEEEPELINVTPEMRMRGLKKGDEP